MKIYVVYKYIADYDTKEVDMMRAFDSEEAAKKFIKDGEKYGLHYLEYKEVELEG